MSQFEFVSRLRRCLAGLPEEEIDRAVEYYEDYFADAGESEEDVIKKLGSPEELAENIRKELSEKQGKAEQGVFTEHGFETEQDRKNYQQIDKFTQLEKKENPFEKQEKTEDNAENKNNGQRTSTSGSYYSGQYEKSKQENNQYHYDDKKERKKNRKFIATLVLVFGIIWLCILLFIMAVYVLFVGRRHSEKTNMEEYAEEVAEVLKGGDGDDLADVLEEVIIGAVAEDDEESSSGDTVSGKADILPDQNIKGLKIDIGAGEVLIQEGEQFALTIKKNPNNMKIKSEVKDGIWKIEEKGGKLHFSLKDLKNIAKNMKKGISVLITVPAGFQADKLDIEVGAGKLTAETLLAKEADFEVSAGKIKIKNLTVTEEMDVEVGMGKIDISSGNIHNLKLECDMGKAAYTGILTGKNKIECNMGSVELKLENDASNYNFSAESDMGSITIDGESYSGVSSSGKQGNGDTEVKLNVAMGSINVKTGVS